MRLYDVCSFQAARRAPPLPPCWANGISSPLVVGRSPHVGNLTHIPPLYSLVSISPCLSCAGPLHENAVSAPCTISSFRMFSALLLNNWMLTETVDLIDRPVTRSRGPGESTGSAEYEGVCVNCRWGGRGPKCQVCVDYVAGADLCRRSVSLPRDLDRVGSALWRE